MLVLAILLVPAALIPPASGSERDARDGAPWASSSTGLPVNANFYGVAFGDFNNDGNADVVGAAESTGVKVYLGDGKGNWTAVGTHPATSGGFNDVRAGDINNDGNQDIVAGSTGIKLYRGNGAGGFTDISSGSGLPTSDNWRGIALGDVNKDGYLDIAATCGYGSSLGTHVYTGNGTGKFKDNSTGLPGNQDRDSSVVLADFNGDGNLDLAAGGAAGVSCYLSNGGAGGTMSWSSSSTGLPSNRFSGVSAGDFNNDGSLDIILSAYNAGSGIGIRAYRNVNNASSWASSSTGLNASGDYIDNTPADFDGDGNLDILTASSYASTYGIHVFYGNGAGSWTWNSTGLPLGEQWVGSDVGDINKDGALDFVLGSYNNRGLRVYKNLRFVAPPPPRPLVSLLEPLGGVSYTGGSDHPIRWDITNGTAPYNITLNYSTDSGLSYPTAISTSIVQADIGTGSFVWQLPVVDSSSVRVRVGVIDSRNQTAANSSPSSFGIDSLAPSVTMVLPLDGAQNVSNATTVRLRFSEGMNRTSAQTAVSVNGPGTPVLVSPVWYGNDLSFQTSGLQMGQRYDISVNASACDDSDPGNGLAEEGRFSFNTSSAPIPTVSLLRPQGDEVWTFGSHQDIQWDASGGTGALAVKLEYSTTGPNGSWLPIADNESNDGLYDWLVPQTPSADCYIRITVNDSYQPPKSSSDSCDSPFTIRAAPVPLLVLLTSPDGGEVLRTGTMCNITWSASGGNGLRQASLRYSTAGPRGPWTNITTGQNDLGIYQWVVPDSPSSTCYVNVTVTDSYDPPQKASDVSNGSFSITTAPQPLNISLISPNGGENWTAGTKRNMTWSASGGAAPLRISLEYSTTGRGGPWNLIAAGLANNGTYQWAVPNASSADCFVRLTANDSDSPPASASDVGDNAFTISVPILDLQRPQVQLVSPVAGQVCKGTVTISFSATDNVGVTRMELFIDGASLGIVASSTADIPWDTTRYSSGPHLVTARAWDAAGNMGEAPPVNVTVNNKRTSPPKEPGFAERYGFLLVVAATLAIVAVLLAVLMMRRGRSQPVAARPPAPSQGAYPPQPVPPQGPGGGGAPPPY